MVAGALFEFADMKDNKSKDNKEKLIKVGWAVSILMIAGGIWALTIASDPVWKWIGGFTAFAGIANLVDAFKKWYRERSRTIGKQERVLDSHSTGYHRIDITDEAVQTKNSNIPFSSITECAFQRFPYRVKPTCVIKYIDQQGSTQEASLQGESFYSGLSIYTNILRISEQHRHRLVQQPHQDISDLATQLRSLDIECEFLDPDFQLNRVNEAELSTSWHVDLGGLELKHSNILQTKIREEGRHVWVGGADAGGGEELHFRYHTNYKIRIQPAFGITCVGKPVKQFPRRVIDYHWEGDKLAQTLNQDRQLRPMLVKAKAPEIKITGNNIHTEDEKFPSLKLFQCIDMVAKRVREEASW